MVLGTVTESGVPYGAVVYIHQESPTLLYFVTKTDTQKFKNIQHNPHVSLTGVQPSDNTTLQVSGKASVESDPTTIEHVMGEMTKVYVRGADVVPPIARLRAGAYQVIRVHVSHIRLADFKNGPVGKQHIFTDPAAH